MWHLGCPTSLLCTQQGIHFRCVLLWLEINVEIQAVTCILMQGAMQRRTEDGMAVRSGPSLVLC